MIFADDLYISEALRKKSSLIKRKLRYGEFVNGVYVIYIKNDGKYEFMKSTYFIQKSVMSFRYNVCALVDSYDEALMFLASREAEKYNAFIETNEND